MFPKWCLFLGTQECTFTKGIFTNIFTRYPGQQLRPSESESPWCDHIDLKSTPGDSDELEN